MYSHQYSKQVSQQQQQYEEDEETKKKRKMTKDELIKKKVLECMKAYTALHLCMIVVNYEVCVASNHVLILNHLKSGFTLIIPIPSPKQAEWDKELADVPIKRVMALNAKEWYLILLGIIGSAINGSIFPLWAIIFGEVLTVKRKIL